MRKGTPFIASLAAAATLVMIPSHAEAVAPQAPAVIVEPSATSSGPYDTDISAKEKAKAAASVSIAKHAWNKDTRTLNYSTANAYDQGLTTVRRQFTRGIIYTGGKVTHLSATERAKIMEIVPRKVPPLPTDVAASGLVKPSALLCTGSNKLVETNPKGPAFIIDTYYNSCRTNTLIAWMISIGTIAGVITGFAWAVPIYGSLMLVITVLSVVGWAWITAARDNSSLHAVWVRDNTHLLSVHSQ